MKRFLKHISLAAIIFVANTHIATAMKIDDISKETDKQMVSALDIAQNKQSMLNQENVSYSLGYIYAWLCKDVNSYTSDNDFEKRIKELDTIFTTLKNNIADTTYTNIIYLTKADVFFGSILSNQAVKLNSSTWTWTPEKIKEWAQKWALDFTTHFNTLNTVVSLENLENLDNQVTSTLEDDNEELEAIEKELVPPTKNDIKKEESKLVFVENPTVEQTKRNAKIVADLCMQSIALKKKNEEAIVIKEVKSSTNALATAWKNIQPDYKHTGIIFRYYDINNPFNEGNTENFTDFVIQLHATIMTFKTTINKNIMMANNDDVKNCAKCIQTIKKELPGMLKTWFDTKENETDSIKTAQEIMTSLTGEGAIFNLDEKEKDQPYFKTISEIQNALNK